VNQPQPTNHQNPTPATHADQHHTSITQTTQQTRSPAQPQPTQTTPRFRHKCRRREMPKTRRTPPPLRAEGAQKKPPAEQENGGGLIFFSYYKMFQALSLGRYRSPVLCRPLRPTRLGLLFPELRKNSPRRRGYSYLVLKN
jgi:hypothetical protein